MTQPSTDERLTDAIRSVNPRISATKLGELLDAIEELMPGEAGIFGVAVEGTRVVVETIEAYGLTIGVDANGRAAEVAFPDGATWTE
jgi:hypothetical protein